MAASPGSIARAPTDGQLRLITKVARMYHERGIRQTDIAETLHLSQARVSRLLKRAAELGIVRTVVAVAPGVHTEVEEALEEKYGIAEAVVVDVEGSQRRHHCRARIRRCDLSGDDLDGAGAHRRSPAGAKPCLPSSTGCGPSVSLGQRVSFSSWEASATHRSRPKAIGCSPNSLDSWGLPPPSSPLLLSLVAGPCERAC